MLGLALKVDKNSSKPLYLQLYDSIKEEIISDRFQPNTKLPSIRQLAEFLKISRTTIETTYHQLSVEGYIISKPKVGYYVSTIEDNIFVMKEKTSALNKKNDEKAKSPANLQYDFRNEYIDKESFDFSLWKRYLNKVLSKDKERLLNYGSFQGEFELRKEIAKYVHNSRGVVCSPEQIIIGAGVQSLLNILCGMLKPEYSCIGFEDPGFKQARHVFRDHDYSIIPIPLENDGISIKKLAASNARIVYVSPSNQFPTGSVMGINKRIKLLNWAHTKDALIIEDDYDSELRYFGRPLPSLQGLNNGSNVIYLGSFSKILLPSIRISYMILPEGLSRQYFGKMSKYNQTSSKIEQLTLAHFMREGMLEKHIRKLRKIYAKKNQILIEGIKSLMGKKVEIIGKETGLHILLELKTKQIPQEITALAERVGVRVIPLANYSIQRQQNKFPLVLLSYSGISIEDIGPAIGLLHQVWFNKDGS